VINVRALGIEQTVKNLQTLSTRLQSNIVRQATRAALNVIAKPIKAQTYGPGRQRITGLLQRSQTVSVSTKAGVVTASLRMRDVSVGGKTKATRAFYWSFLEQSTPPRYTHSGKTAMTLGFSGGRASWRKRRQGVSGYRGFITPRPWVVPAFDSLSGAALDTFQDVLRTRVDEESANLPKGV
jgi:hypothetical protein